MNLIFLSIFEEFQNLFRDGFLSNINTEGLEGSNARDLVRSYFENNPLPNVGSSNPGYDFISQGLINIQRFLGEVSMGEGSLIASAPILLLAASVVIILGVLGEAFFKKTGIPDIAFLMVLGIIIDRRLRGINRRRRPLIGKSVSVSFRVWFVRASERARRSCVGV